MKKRKNEKKRGRIRGRRGRRRVKIRGR